MEVIRSAYVGKPTIKIIDKNNRAMANALIELCSSNNLQQWAHDIADLKLSSSDRIKIESSDTIEKAGLRATIEIRRNNSRNASGTLRRKFKGFLHSHKR